MSGTHTQLIHHQGFQPGEIAEMSRAAEAVWQELGLRAQEKARRRAVEERIISAFRDGRRQPLYLVDAGLCEN